MSTSNNEFDAKFFDDASAAWMTNKKKRANCTYVYKCTYKHTDGKACDKAVTIQTTMRCWAHRGRVVRKEL
jgi:hypothetical protein